MGADRDPTLLTYSMRQAHLALVRNVERQHGIQIQSADMARDPWTQARLWRQSRSTDRIQQGSRKMATLGLHWLRSVLEEVGPQSGPWATNALPGLGWHQWGQAVDYWIPGVDGRPIWDASHWGYLVLGEEAARLGLTSGYFWKQRDAGHVQLHRARVREAHSWSRIDHQMKARWAK